MKYAATRATGPLARNETAMRPMVGMTVLQIEYMAMRR